MRLEKAEGEAEEEATDLQFMAQIFGREELYDCERPPRFRWDTRRKRSSHDSRYFHNVLPCRVCGFRSLIQRTLDGCGHLKPEKCFEKKPDLGFEIPFRNDARAASKFIVS